MCQNLPLRIIICAISLLVLQRTSFAQNTTVDSLLTIVNEHRANAEVYNQLALEHWYLDINKSKEFASIALRKALEERDSVQIGFAYNRLGTAYLFLNQSDSSQINYSKSASIFENLKMYNEFGGATACCAKVYELKFEYDKAIQEYTKSLKVFEMLETSEYYVQTLIVVGNLFAKLGIFESAKEYFDLAVENKSFLNNYDQIMMYNHMGVNFQNLGDYDHAIHSFEQAFALCDLKNNDISLAKTYVNTGALYVAWGKKEAALDYFEKGLAISKSAGLKNYCRTILALLGDTYLDLGEQDKAKEYYEQLLNNTTDSNDQFNDGRAHNGLAKIHTYEHQYQEAIKHSYKALEIFDEIKRPIYTATSHYILAENYLYLRNLAETQKHLIIASSIAEKNSLKDLEADITLLNARYNSVVNNGVESNKFYEKYIALKDSLFAEQNQELLAQFQVKLNNLEKDFMLNEAVRLNKLKEAELIQKKKQITFISIVGMLLLASVLVIIMLYVKKQKANRLLFLKNKELVKQESIAHTSVSTKKISKSVQNLILLRLNEEIEKNKIHLNKDLSLHSLSKILETNSSYLSRIISVNYNSSFSIYLNKLRIVEAQRMILDKHFDQYTIDAISQECGYNSKSTFNKAFKEITGLTPNEYKRQNAL